MTWNDWGMALALLILPLGLYMGLVTIAPARPKVRRGERALQWVSRWLWWLVAINGLLWAAAHLLYQQGWHRAAMTLVVLSAPILVATSACGIISANRQFTDSPGESRGRRS
jgi:hypothetical protein